MIDSSEVGRLLGRLSAQRGFDFVSDDGKAELARALGSAQTVDQAEEVVDWLLEHMPDRATPADIRSRLAATAVRGGPRRDQSCPHCKGSGMRTAWFLKVLYPNREIAHRRIVCGSCTRSGGGCNALIVPQGSGAKDRRGYSVDGLFYCEARAKQIDLPVVMDSGCSAEDVASASEPCPACAFGQARGMAYHEREAEQAAKVEKRRAG